MPSTRCRAGPGRCSVMGSPLRASLAAPLIVAVLTVLRAGFVDSTRALQQQHGEGLVDEMNFSWDPAQTEISGEDTNGSGPLCYSGPDDIGREISGSIEHAPPPPGEGFSPEQLQRFPYVSAGYCRTFNQPLQLVPTDCELPGFDPLQFIEQFRGHRLIFWGDSVTRQFFFYMLLRLSRYSMPSIGQYAGTAEELPEADPINCKQHGSMSHDLHVDAACFDLPPKDIADEKGCSYYFDNTTAICYVRAERRLIDNRNVVYWNGLKETDILFMNVGLHHNSKGMYKYQLAGFVRLAHYYKAKYKKLPLMLYRDTSAQHFEGGDGGNFPGKSQELIEKLRSVDPDTFRCADHPYEVMQKTNWRNDFLTQPGFKDPWGTMHGVQMKFPIMRVWNTTAMGSNFHPRTLGGRTAEAMEGATADCTHFCPSFGGIYEVWSTLLHNILRAGQPLEETLRPRFTSRSKHQFRTVGQGLSPLNV